MGEQSPVVEFVTGREIYERVILGAVPSAEQFVWIGTADIKDLYVAAGAHRMVPFLQVLSELIDDGVEVRLIHAKEPGPAFRKDFDEYPSLLDGLEQILCPRVHFKCVVVDGSFAYSGSANLTGAGMGAKSDSRRNFESGIVTGDRALIGRIMQQFDEVWMGKHCADCGRREFCADYQDLL
ncbi:MAG: phospholipase [Chitinivibrionales bacterium]|nr:phospholipase [Chitinivibrionales bacterium]